MSSLCLFSLLFSLVFPPASYHLRSRQSWLPDIFLWQSASCAERRKQKQDEGEVCRCFTVCGLRAVPAGSASCRCFSGICGRCLRESAAAAAGESDGPLVAPERGRERDRSTQHLKQGGKKGAGQQELADVFKKSS